MNKDAGSSIVMEWTISQASDTKVGDPHVLEKNQKNRTQSVLLMWQA